MYGVKQMQLVTLDLRFIVQSKAVLGKILGLCSGAKRFGSLVCFTPPPQPPSRAAIARTQLNLIVVVFQGMVFRTTGTCRFHALVVRSNSMRVLTPSVQSFLCKTRNRNVSRQQSRARIHAATCCARSPKCSLFTRAAALCERESSRKH